jgi:hypothetical protein
MTHKRFFTDLRMQQTNNNSKTIFAQGTIDFVTVAAEFCAYLEQSSDRSKENFVDTMLKLLPFLYVKAHLVKRVESNGDFLPDDKVTEEDYNWIRNIIYSILGNDDDYEELVFDPNTQSDETKWSSISENLADMYQSLRNFVSAYQIGIEDCMHDALWLVMDQFELFWGKCLVDSLSRLHQVKYKITGDSDEDSL